MDIEIETTVNESGTFYKVRGSSYAFHREDGPACDYYGDHNNSYYLMDYLFDSPEQYWFILPHWKTGKVIVNEDDMLEFTDPKIEAEFLLRFGGE